MSNSFAISKNIQTISISLSKDPYISILFLITSCVGLFFLKSYWFRESKKSCCSESFPEILAILEIRLILYAFVS